MWYEPFHCTDSGYVTHLKVFLRDKIIYRPGYCLITPETLLPVSICCLGYQSETKPHERRFHTSTAPANIVSFLMRPLHRVLFSRLVQNVNSPYLQWSNCESAHVVPEDQCALRPSRGDDGCQEVSGLTIVTIWTVCKHIPTLLTVPIREKTESTDHNYPHLLSKQWISASTESLHHYWVIVLTFLYIKMT